MNREKNILLENWITTTVGELSLSIQYGYTAKAVMNDTGCKYLRITDIRDDVIDWNKVPFCQIDETNLQKFKLQKGDLLFARTGSSVGNSYLLTKQVNISVFASYLVRIILSRFISKKYVYYFFNSKFYWNQISSKKSGIAQPNVNANKLSKIQIHIPPLEEQERIVQKIEELFSELDYGLQNIEKVKEKLKIYRQSILKENFDPSLTTAQTRKEWQTKTLDDVCLKIQDGTHFSPKNQLKERKEDSYLYLTSKNIRMNQLDLSDVKFIDAETHQTIYNRCNPEYGDVLLTKDGSNTGNVCINTLEEEFSLLSSVCLLKPNQELVLSRYLAYYIQSPVGHLSIIGRMSGTAIKRIILKQIRSAKIKFPPINVQEDIIREIEAKFSLIENVEQFLATNSRQLEMLRHSILKKAFEGKLVEQDAEDEPVEKLLDRIKKEKEIYLQLQKEKTKKQRSKKRNMKNVSKKSLSILEVLKNSKTPMLAKDVWKKSKYSDDIEGFYAELKNVENKINEVRVGKDAKLTLKQ